jgi:hypothetical protein
MLPRDADPLPGFGLAHLMAWHFPDPRAAVRARNQTPPLPWRAHAAQLALDAHAEVLKNVESVRDLPGVRRSVPRTLGVNAVTVASNILDPGMAAEPGLRRGRLPVRKHVQYLAPFQIDDDRSVA